MFSNQETLLRNEHRPDVVSGLSPFREHSKMGVMPAGTIVNGLIFPPFDFSYSIHLAEDGRVTATDSLPDDLKLMCLPYSFEGEELPFEEESFAAAWAYLRYTPRRVVRRPTSGSLFGVSSRSSGFSESIATVSCILCGADAWLLGPNIDWALEEEVVSEYVKLTVTNSETLSVVDLSYLRGEVTVALWPHFPTSIFKDHRKRIIESLGKK
jgi:hypothetical protein